MRKVGLIFLIIALGVITSIPGAYAQTASEGVSNLIEYVKSLNLQQGIENSLDAKLAAAQDALNSLKDGLYSTAVNKLQAFINEVEAQRGKFIDDKQANYLITQAQFLIQLIKTMGAISGVVTKESDGLPITDVNVPILIRSLTDGKYTIYETSSSLFDGSYLLTGLPSGLYRVESTGPDYPRERYYDTTSGTRANPVEVKAGIITSNINFTLPEGGTYFTGQVTFKGKPVPRFSIIAAADRNGQMDLPFYGSYTDKDGNFRLPVAPGTYRISAWGFLYEQPGNPNLASQWYDGNPEGTRNFGKAKPFTIPPGDTISGINFNLYPGGIISGMVTTQDGSPAATVFVEAWDIDKTYSGPDATTWVDGTFTLRLLPGNYILRASPAYANLKPQMYSQEITVSQGQEVSGIDFILDPKGPATTLWYSSGDNQSGPVGQRLLAPFVVRVTDATSWGIFGVPVKFEVTSGDGTLTVTEILTNSRGEAKTHLIPGPGINTVVATSSALPGQSVTFTAYGWPPTITGATPFFTYSPSYLISGSPFVWNTNTPSGLRTELLAYVNDPDGDLPGSIKALTVAGPNEFYHSFSPGQYYVESETEKYYYFGSPIPARDGTYIFTVIDKDGNWNYGTKTIIINTIPLPDPYTFSPQNGATNISITPTLSWGPITYAGPLYYRVRIDEWTGSAWNTIYRSPRSPDILVNILLNLLKYGTKYRWRVEAWDAATGVEASNRSISSWVTFTTTGAPPPSPPASLKFTYTMAQTRNDPSGTRMYFQAQVVDENNNPVSNASVTVTTPNGQIISLNYQPGPENYDRHFWTIVAGNYTFNASVDGISAEPGIRYISGTILPIPTLYRPSPDPPVASQPVTLSWEPVFGAEGYWVILFDSSTNQWIWDSAHMGPGGAYSGMLTTTSVTVPSETLSSGKTYRWELNAVNDISNFIINADALSQNYGTFTVQ